MVGCLLSCTMPCSSITMCAVKAGHSYGVALQVLLAEASLEG
jgi:hypothetical protein